MNLGCSRSYYRFIGLVRQIRVREAAVSISRTGEIMASPTGDNCEAHEVGGWFLSKTAKQDYGGLVN